MALDLTQLKGLFFDIYATLIDWEAGIYPHLYRLSQRAPQSQRLSDSSETRTKLLGLYEHYCKKIWKDHPAMLFPEVLEKVYAHIASDLGAELDLEAQAAFGRSIGEWPAFPDTIDAMKVLAKYYKLFVLSNVDNASFDRTRTGPLGGGHWDGIYTAEMIGSYKPDPRNYQYVAKRMEEDFSIEKDELIIVAQSLDIDHITTTKLGFKPGVWIARSQNSTMGGKREELESQGLLKLGAVYETLGEFAAAVEKAFADKKN
ncbi:haloacid dehalogenase, type II [Exophiala mesophila]|uniref:Haloacid dehalogenase, type II n=1 Tax=Exophiala mesophila TaxID=212818 RepID=A0A0D1Y3D3_EXOME|nr:haloacid dehalogenase, type II [Exophiala mesophila]KIV95106.1 haloacid dehalogenase, type II [Exophiala mesophila]